MPAITMPQLGESVTEGTIGRWLKKPGDRVARDEPLVEIITDKVNAEIPSPTAGVLERIVADEGAVIAVGQEIAFLATEQDQQAATAPDRSGSAATAPTQEAAAAPARPAEVDGEEPRSSPLVRKLAKEHGLDLRLIRGTGLGGRVTRDDVEAYLRERPSAGPAVAVATAPTAAEATTPLAAPSAPAMPPAPAPASAAATGETRIAPSPMRRTIAQRMAQSAREIPHAWLMVEVDVTRLVQLREGLKERFRQSEGVELTYLPFTLKAAVDALREHPVVNASWVDNQILLKREINLGVAIALEDGLIVPVIRGADQLNVAGLAYRLEDLKERARTGKLTVADVEGGTFTVNNTGAFGSIASQPIINYPQAAIMNMETIVKRPVVIDDAIAIRSMVNVCLSFDHRIMDGATAGRFLQSVKRRLESWGPGSAL
jgi:2-oxoisovalerate dehydrogenase E2 component (dihydrolipoyl transacylase)